MLWSLLKSKNRSVISSAALALSPCLEMCKDSSQLVRSFVGGLELIVGLLHQKNSAINCPDYQKISKLSELTPMQRKEIHLLASICGTIASIAQDSQNLAVITDHNVVPLLAELTVTRHPKLRCQLSKAIASCCQWGSNRRQFGEMNVIQNLIYFLKTTRENSVLVSATKALNQLSKEPINCDELYKCGAVRVLKAIISRVGL